MKTPCGQCGMPVEDGPHYHPFAACLMFKQARNSTVVEANLAAVVEYGASRAAVRIRGALMAEMNGPGIDWSDVDEVASMIDRVCTKGAP